jgi:hypothetical protein
MTALASDKRLGWFTEPEGAGGESNNRRKVASVERLIPTIHGISFRSFSIVM